eukprot:m.270175 g.270175  ORF g.270175 m.270175 type:complete len:344 (+) comp16074_c1_seq3:3099-4130(+)
MIVSVKVAEHLGGSWLKGHVHEAGRDAEKCGAGATTDERDGLAERSRLRGDVHRVKRLCRDDDVGRGPPRNVCSVVLRDVNRSNSSIRWLIHGKVVKPPFDLVNRRVENAVGCDGCAVEGFLLLRVPTKHRCTFVDLDRMGETDVRHHVLQPDPMKVHVFLAVLGPPVVPKCIRRNQAHEQEKPGVGEPSLERNWKQELFRRISVVHDRVVRVSVDENTLAPRLVAHILQRFHVVSVFRIVRLGAVEYVLLVPIIVMPQHSDRVADLTRVPRHIVGGGVGVIPVPVLQGRTPVHVGPDWHLVHSTPREIRHPIILDRSIILNLVNQVGNKRPFAVVNVTPGLA